MKKKIFAIMAATLSLGLTAATNAQSIAMSTEDLLTYCKGTDASFVTCEIYGQAVYDTYLVFSQHRHLNSSALFNRPPLGKT